MAVATCVIENGFLFCGVLGEDVFSTWSGSISEMLKIPLLGPEARDNDDEEKGYRVYLSVVAIAFSTSSIE